MHAHKCLYLGNRQWLFLHCQHVGDLLFARYSAIYPLVGIISANLWVLHPQTPQLRVLAQSHDPFYDPILRSQPGSLWAFQFPPHSDQFETGPNIAHPRISTPGWILQGRYEMGRLCPCPASSLALLHIQVRFFKVFLRSSYSLFWGLFEVFLKSSWGLFEVFLRSFWGLLRSFWGHFEVFFKSFWGLFEVAWKVFYNLIYFIPALRPDMDATSCLAGVALAVVARLGLM